MNDKLNAIIIDGEMYVLTRTMGASDCDSCALRNNCGRDEDMYFCLIFEAPNGFNFQHAEHMVCSEQTVERRIKKGGHL